MKVLVFALLLLASFSPVRGAAQSAAEMDYSKLAPRPRLFLKAGAEKEIEKCIRKNPAFAIYHNSIIAYCDQLLDKPLKPCSGSGRGVALARATLKDVFWLSYAYRMTRTSKYAERAEAEMLNICDYDNWAPEHYLDVAERLMALAIGYDWLYDTLAEASREKLRSNILEKGLHPALMNEYKGIFTTKNNWNPVCMAGITAVCLAIYEDIPEMAQELIEKCIVNNPRSLEMYGPDGGYPEGYTYWGYGTAFQILLVEALEGALGSSAGLLDSEPAFFRSPRYIQFMTTPARKVFSYSDTQLNAVCNVMNFWFADRNDDLSLIWLDMRELQAGRANFEHEDRLLPMLMIFASRLDIKNVTPPTDKFWFSRGVAPVFVYRAGWDSATDTYLGVKGGSANAPHGHMDAGSFFFEKDGVSWGTDLGLQSYGGFAKHGIAIWDSSQTGSRWDIFRLSGTSHSTLTVNGNRHNVSGFAHITETYTEADKKGARVDMTPVLESDLSSAVRSVWLDGDDVLHVEDEVSTRELPAKISWILCTATTPKILSENTVELRKGRKRMILEVESPAQVSLSILSNQPSTAFDEKNPGTFRVEVAAELAAGRSMRIAVKLYDPSL